MGRKEKVSAAIKLETVEVYLSNRKSVIQLAKEIGVRVTSIRRWISKYKSLGTSGLINRNTNNKISTLSEVEAGKTSFKGTTLLEFKYGKALFDKEQIVVKNTIQVYFNKDFLYVIALDKDVKYQMTSQAYEKLDELCV